MKQSIESVTLRFSVLFTILSCAISASAQTSTFTDRTTFRDAAGGNSLPQYIEDFNDISLTPGGSEPFSSFTGDFMLTQTGDGFAAFKQIDSKGQNVDGTVFVATDLDNSNGDDTVSFVFSSPVTAIGFDLNGTGTDHSILFTTNVVNESGFYLLPTTDITEFRGFVFTTPVTTFTIDAAPLSDFAYHGIDNVELFYIPEPSVIALISLVALFLFVRGFRHQRVA